MTRQRRAMMAELSSQDGFRSAQQVHEDLSASGTKIGLATVYRNLQELAETQQIDTLRAEDGETLYRHCAVDSHHHHLVCRSCGLVKEIAPIEVETWVKEVSAEKGFTDVQHSIELSGLCPQCSE